MVPIEMSSSHSYSTSVHIIGLSCALWLQYTTQQTDSQPDRKSDRNRPPMLQHRRPKKFAVIGWGRVLKPDIGHKSVYQAVIYIDALLWGGGVERVTVDGEEISAAVTKLAYWKVIGVNRSLAYDCFRLWNYLYL